jgi:hypothetical protein
VTVAAFRDVGTVVEDKDAFTNLVSVGISTSIDDGRNLN